MPPASSASGISAHRIPTTPTHPNAFPLAHGFDVWDGTNVSNDYTHPAVKLIRSNPAGTTPIPGYEILVDKLATDIPVHEDLTRRYRDLSVASSVRTRTILSCSTSLRTCHTFPCMPGPSSRESPVAVFTAIASRKSMPWSAPSSPLWKLKASRKTPVIFTSDNGPWIRFENTASHPLYGEARLLVGSALPFRDGKGSTWEGGVRVPGVWYWPGTIPPRTVVRTPASTMDVLPTAFALAGEPLPGGRTLDGRDIRP